MQADNPEVEELKKKLNGMQESYSVLMEEARLSLSSSNLQKAVDRVKAALKICPKDTKLKQLKEEIEEKDADEYWLRENKREIYAAIGKWSLISVMTIFGVGALLLSSTIWGSIALVLTILSVILNLKCETKLYEVFDDWSFPDSDVQIFGLMQGLIVSITGLIALVIRHSSFPSTSGSYVIIPVIIFLAILIYAVVGLRNSGTIGKWTLTLAGIGAAVAGVVFIVIMIVQWFSASAWPWLCENWGKIFVLGTVGTGILFELFTKKK